MSPAKGRVKSKPDPPASTSAGTQTSDPIDPPPPPPVFKESIIAAALRIESPSTSPTFQASGKTPPRRVLRLKCNLCNDYPDGFRSEHELRRHTNRVHRKTRKVWVTIDTSPDQTFLANCKACQSGKRYNECYNAASHLRRMHFHPHKRGERKMSAAEARRGGKPGDLDPPMEVLKQNWLREVEEVVPEDGGDPIVVHRPEEPMTLQLPQSQSQPAPKKTEARAPPTPTTPSTRSMAIDSIVDKVDAQ